MYIYIYMYKCICIYYVYIYIYMVPPPQRSTIVDLPFYYLMVWDDNQAINWKKYILYIYIYINTYTYTQAYALNQQNVANTYRRTHADTSQKNANFANFPGFKIQVSGRNFLNPGLDCHPGPHVSQRLDSSFFFPQTWILNPKNLQTLQTFLDP